MNTFSENNKKTSCLFDLRFCLLFISLFFISFLGGEIFAKVTPSGTFTNRIPIKLPKGLSPIAPNLALTYKSGSGNGMVGVGWHLSGLSTITRINDGQGIQYNIGDTYAHSGVGKLVDIGGGIYHSEEESFMKLVPSGSCGGGPCSWVSTDKKGTKYTYGLWPDSRIQAVGKNGSIRIWALSMVMDLRNIFYIITYNNDSINGDYYPKKITFSGAVRDIRFSYETRSDAYETYKFNEQFT